MFALARGTVGFIESSRFAPKEGAPNTGNEGASSGIFTSTSSSVAGGMVGSLISECSAKGASLISGMSRLSCSSAKLGI